MHQLKEQSVKKTRKSKELGPRLQRYEKNIKPVLPPLVLFKLQRSKIHRDQ